MELMEAPSIFYPTTVLLVDDNERFLKHISLQLNGFLNYKLFENPISALTYFKNNLEAKFDPQQYIVDNVESNSCERGHYSTNIDLRSIHKAIYNKNRFKVVSVVVLDYAMPDIDGLEFCRRLQGTGLKKIMLTGQADHEIAVQAFNEGLIDQFILKSEKDLTQKLSRSILEMRKKYFLELSTKTINSFSHDPMYCLKNPKVVEVFKSLCTQHEIIEYYLFDASGTLLLLDTSGNPFWFVVKSSLELKMYVALAEDDGLDKDLCEQLNMGEKIPFFANNELENSEWKSCLHPAKKIDDGKISYYYAFLTGALESGLCPENISSYSDYLKEQVSEAAFY